jgi:hypothetical protein
MPHAIPFVGGLALALANIAITWRLSPKKAADFYTLFMAATAFFYFGSALPTGNINTLLVEIAVSGTLFCLALTGQWKSLKFTAVAFLAHGTWDLLHVAKGMGANAGEVFPVVCVAYDWVIAGYLWWLAPRANPDRGRAAA